MAIDAYTGLPRSGKSYSVVKNVILPSLREGRQVYTNIPMTPALIEEFPEGLHQLPGDWFTRLDLADLFPPGAVVVLDELWRRWPSGMKANAVNFKDKEFLAEHGHLVDEFGNTTRVVLVSQDLSQIAAFARDLVAVTYRTTKLDGVGADNRFRVDVYRGAVTGQRPPKSQQIRSLFDKYDPAIYRYYKSSTKSVTGDVGDESRADKRANIWRSPFIIFSIVGPLLGIPFLVWYAADIFSSGFGAGDKLEPVEPQPAAVALVNPLPGDMVPATQGTAVAASAAPAGPSLSNVWRVAGHIKRSTDTSRPVDSWASRVGYNLEPEQADQPGTMPDVVLLTSSFAGSRYIPATDCEQYPDGVHWHCTVDGELVTPWTGKGGSTGWASDGEQLVTKTATVATGQQVNPPPK